MNIPKRHLAKDVSSPRPALTVSASPKGRVGRLFDFFRRHKVMAAGAAALTLLGATKVAMKNRQNPGHERPGIAAKAPVPANVARVELPKFDPHSAWTNSFAGFRNKVSDATRTKVISAMQKAFASQSMPFGEREINRSLVSLASRLVEDYKENVVRRDWLRNTLGGGKYPTGRYTKALTTGLASTVTSTINDERAARIRTLYVETSLSLSAQEKRQFLLFLGDFKARHYNDLDKRWPSF